MEAMTHKAEPRTALGTRATRSLREKGGIPAIIYGHGEPPVAIALCEHDVEVALAHHQRTLDVDFQGEAKQYLIKDVQYDHLDHLPIHVDLMRVHSDERVQVTIGVELRGVPKGVAEGGILEQTLGEVEVDCLVTQIPDTLRLAVSGLGVDEHLLVSDLELPPGVTMLTDGDERICTVRVLVQEEEEEEAVEAEEEAAQPEVIGRGKKEEEESEESKD